MLFEVFFFFKWVARNKGNTKLGRSSKIDILVRKFGKKVMFQF